MKVPYLAEMELRQARPPCTERQLQLIWHKQRHLAPLVTRAGESVEVLSPGVWNRGPGPDFLKAHLRIDGYERRGAIELHLEGKSWYDHGHHRDAAYDKTILHVVLWPDLEAPRTETNLQERVPLLFLAPFLSFPLDRVLLLLQEESPLRQALPPKGRCTSLFGSLETSAVQRLLEGAALARLRNKWQEPLKQTEAAGCQPLLWLLASCLGVPRDRQTFGQLYLLLEESLNEASSLESRYALCLGACGLLNSSATPASWCTEPLHRLLLKEWEKLQGRLPLPTPIFSLYRQPHRPFHQLWRRLLLLAQFSRAPLRHQLADQWRLLWQREWDRSEAAAIGSRWADRFIQLWPCYTEKGSSALPTSSLALGATMAQELILNGLLPYLYGEVVQSDLRQQKRLVELYASLPPASYQLTRYLRHRLFSEAQQHSSLLHKPLYGQGALQLHADFCRHYEASCSGCPFVERMERRWPIES